MPDSRIRAEARVSVISHAATPFALGPGPKLLEIRIEESFTGDLHGLSTVRALQIAHDDDRATLLTLQRFDGRLKDKSGSFVLRGEGHVEKGQIKVTWSVVPDSGTDALVGLRGEGGFEGTFGQGSEANLAFWFDAA